MMIINSILWFLVGMVNGLKDRSALNRFKNSYWNKGEGWKYKWQGVELEHMFYRIPLLDGRKWYYFGLHKLTHAEKFPYSTTALVFLTDGWHLLQFIQFKLAALSVVVTYKFIEYDNPITTFTAIIISFGIGFWITYESKENE